MFNIPMNTTGAMDSSSLLSLNGGNANGSGMNQQPQQNMNMGQQGYNQPPQQNMGGMSNGYNQQNMNNGYNQQPQQNMNNGMQPGYNQNNGMNNGYNQPQQNMNNGMGMNQQAQQNNGAMQPRQRPAGNGVHLKKGQKVALAGVNGAALSSIQVCLGWDINNQACDLDASAFMLGADGRVIGDDWFVFYGQTNSPDNSVIHSGDSTNGAAVGDDEVININLATINPNVKKITFVVTINEALEKGLNFSMVSNAYVRVVDKSTGQELNRFQLTDYYSNVTAMVVGEVYNHNGQWKFNAVGDGVAKDLYGLCAMYGVNVAD